jgi:Family of unknown function (DUF6516)
MLRDAMATTTRDDSLDALLVLDGQMYVLDENGDYWVQFEVKEIAATPEKPHGLDYSLTMHGPRSGKPNDSRLVGFDNAHAVRSSKGPGGKTKKAWDHKHRFRTVQPYDYTDAATLLSDFWDQVYSVLNERGVRYD